MARNHFGSLALWPAVNSGKPDLSAQTLVRILEERCACGRNPQAHFFTYFYPGLIGHNQNLKQVIMFQYPTTWIDAGLDKAVGPRSGIHR